MAGMGAKGAQESGDHANDVRVRQAPTPANNLMVEWTQIDAKRTLMDFCDAARYAGFARTCVPIRRAKESGVALDVLVESEVGGASIRSRIMCSIDLRIEGAFDSLREDLLYASYFRVGGVVIYPDYSRLEELGAALADGIALGIGLCLWIVIPLSSRSEHVRFNALASQSHDEFLEPWRWWRRLHAMSGFHQCTGVCLVVDAKHLPEERHVIARWHGEILSCAVVHTDDFAFDNSGVAIEGAEFSRSLKQLLATNLHIFVTRSSNCPIEGLSLLQAFLIQLRKIAVHEFSPAWPSDFAGMSVGHMDETLKPLQPLANNLDSSVYEVFELDQIKYPNYQAAIALALSDQLSAGSISVGGEDATIFVAGAGRGPLVERSIAAADSVGLQKIRIVAIEKNAAAALNLQFRADHQWNQGVSVTYEAWTNLRRVQVDVVTEDMRSWQPPAMASIIVSELLGSFGCNELSPECLFGIQRHLKPGGCMIPVEYTNYLCPVSAAVHWEIAAASELDTMHIVRLHRHHRSGESQPLFTFSHPDKGDGSFDAVGTLSWTMSHEAVVTGLAGAFECILYRSAAKENVGLSTVAEKQTPTLMSWFPAYLPLRRPLTISAGARLTARIERTQRSGKVFYTWCVTEPESLPVQNCNGKQCSVSLSI